MEGKRQRFIGKHNCNVDRCSLGKANLKFKAGLSPVQPFCSCQEGTPLGIMTQFSSPRNVSFCQHLFLRVPLTQCLSVGFSWSLDILFQLNPFQNNSSMIPIQSVHIWLLRCRASTLHCSEWKRAPSCQSSPFGPADPRHSLLVLLPLNFCRCEHEVSLSPRHPSTITKPFQAYRRPPCALSTVGREREKRKHCRLSL